MFGIGGGEIVMIALVALLLFGPGRLPELARSIAKGYREFLKLRQQMTDAVDDLKADIDIDLEEKSTAPRIQRPSGTRVSSLGDEHAEAPATELIELEVPEEDDYLDPERFRGGEEQA